jgi:hypothetical protein
MVRRAFPATSDISGEFRFHSEVCLVVLFTGTSLFSRIHHLVVVFLMHLSLAKSSHGRPRLRRLRSTRLVAPLLTDPIHPTTPHVPRGSAPRPVPCAPLQDFVEQQRRRRLWLLSLGHGRRASPAPRRRCCRGQRRHAAQPARPSLSPVPPWRAAAAPARPPCHVVMGWKSK